MRNDVNATTFKQQLTREEREEEASKHRYLYYFGGSRDQVPWRM